MQTNNFCWLSRVVVACFIAAMSVSWARADDERPVVDDSQFGKEKPAPLTRPRLFLVGDSTVKSGDGPDTGWGEVIGRYFDPRKIDVVNRAIAGRSTRMQHEGGLHLSILSVEVHPDHRPAVLHGSHQCSSPWESTTQITPS